MSLSGKAAGEPDGPLKLLLSKNGTLIDTCTISINNLIVSFYRGGNCKFEEKSPFFDEVTLRENNASPLPPEDRIEIVTLIFHKLKALDPHRSATSWDNPEQAQLNAIHTATLERLEALNEELIRKSSEFREHLEEEHRNKLAEVEEHLRVRAAQLDAEYQAKKEEADAERARLDKRLKEVDARDNTYVRRELRQILQKEISQRSEAFGLTKGTIRLRLPIHVASCLLIVAFGAGSVWYGKELYQHLNTDNLPLLSSALVALKPFALAFAAIGIAVFYLRWMNRWFEQHSQAEFHMKQFQLDVDRASWIVESALEWKASLGSAIPTVLMESITRNLFSKDQPHKDVPLHPADQLASALLGTASKVRLKAGDAELEFEGKRLKKEMGSTD